MPGKADDIDALFARWHALSRADRKAIMRRLPGERRLELQEVLARHAAERGATSWPFEQSGQYAAYSPWLGRLLSDCGEETHLLEGTAALTPAVRETLLHAHAEAEAASPHRPGRSLLDLVRSFVAEWRIRP